MPRKDKMNQVQHDEYYGLAPWMTEEEKAARIKEITRIAKNNGDIDEDTMDSVAMDSRYEPLNLEEDGIDESTNLEPYDIQNDR